MIHRIAAGRKTNTQAQFWKVILQKNVCEARPEEMRRES